MLYTQAKRERERDARVPDLLLCEERRQFARKSSFLSTAGAYWSIVGKLNDNPMRLSKFCTHTESNFLLLERERESEQVKVQFCPFTPPYTKSLFAPIIRSFPISLSLFLFPLPIWSFSFYCSLSLQCATNDLILQPCLRLRVHFFLS